MDVIVGDFNFGNLFNLMDTGCVLIISHQIHVALVYVSASIIVLFCKRKIFEFDLNNSKNTELEPKRKTLLSAGICC